MVLPSDKKLQQWNELEKQCRAIVDKLDRPIDAGIFETVVVFQALGINTSGSCEGHLDHGTLGPWIDIDAYDVKEDERTGMRLLATLNSSSFSSEEVEKQRIYANSLIEKVNRKRLEIRAQVLNHLTAFYKERPHISADARLCIQGIVLQRYIDGSRLESQGVGIQRIRSLEEQQQALKRYQAEMKAFTLFLKDLYFSN